MHTKKSNATRNLTLAAMIAALYVVLTYISHLFGLDSGAIQLRLSEALTILPCFTAAAIPGLGIGCVLANLLSSCAPWDVVCGSLATLLGACGTYLLRRHKYLAPLPPILANAAIVPLVLLWVYHLEDTYLFLLATVSAGEILCCYGLGLALYSILDKHRDAFHL